MEASPTDEDLFELAERLLAGIGEQIRSDPAFIRESVLQLRDMWVLLFEAHRFDEA